MTGYDDTERRLRDLAIDAQITRLRAIAAARCGLDKYPAEQIRRHEAPFLRTYLRLWPDRDR